MFEFPNFYQISEICMEASKCQIGVVVVLLTAQKSSVETCLAYW